MRSRLAITLAAAGVALAGGGATLLVGGLKGVDQSAAAGATAAFSSEMIAFPDTTVVASDGAALPFRDATGDGLLVLTFAYTTCESICPAGLQIMKAIDDRVGDLGRPVRLLTITINPSFDTPGRMRKAAKDFDASPRWLWLTGRPAELDRLLARLGARAADIALHDPIFLVGDARSGQFARTVGLPDPDQIVARLKEFDR